MTIEIFSDGACDNKLKEAPMGMGVAVFLDQVYNEDYSRSIGLTQEQASDKSTSNVSEWLACVEAMRIAADLKKFYPKAVIICYSDSQIIAYQFNGKYIIKKDNFQKYHDEAKKNAKLAGVKEIKWIPREKNTKADELSKEGLKLTKQVV